MKIYTKVILAIVLLMTGTDLANAQRIMVTASGSSATGFTGDGGPSAMAKMNTPYDIKLDAAHNLYFVDQGNNRIRKISAKNGIITTVAGGGSSTANGVPATSESLSGLSYLAIDGAANLYFTMGNVVREVDAVTGMITTMAGTGSPGFSGDGGLANAATLWGPSGICIDAANNIYVVDASNDRIRKIDAASGVITTIAGNGTAGYSGDGGAATAAKISDATAICVNALGDIYFSDQSTTRIRKVTAATGIISPIAGDGSGGIYGTGNGGPATHACIGNVHGVAVDGNGDVYIDDDSCACRKITMSTGIINIVSGDQMSEGYNGDAGNALSIWFNYPTGLCIDATGNIYVADKENNRIRTSIQLTHQPVFAYGKGQTINPCPGYASSINDQLAIADLDTLQTETWTILTPPINGALTGFPATKLSGGRSGLATPAGTFYTPSASYTGLDSFQIMVSDGTLSDTVTLYAKVAIVNPGTITGSSSLCVGVSTTLGETVSGGTWSVTNSNATIPLTSGTVTPLTPGVDTVIYTLSAPCPVTATHTFTVNPVPVVGSITGLDTICAGSTTIYSDSVAGGTWSRTGTGIATVVAATGVVTGQAYGTATLRYAVSNTVCTGNATKTITVMSPATAITGTNVVCLASTISLADVIGGGVWSASNGNATIVAAGATSATVTGILSGIDTITYTNTNMCGTASKTAIISVNPPAVPGTISGASSACLGGGTIHYTETSSGGAWSTSNTSAHMGPAGNLTLYSAGVDTLIYTVSNACNTATATYVVNISSAASAGTITGPGSVCAGSSVTLADAVTGGTWSASNTNVSVSGSGTLAGLTPGTVTITYGTSSTCGTASTTAVIVVDPVPAAGTITSVASVCVGATILAADPAAGGTWSTGMGNATVSGSGIITGVTSGLDVVSYTVTNSCGSVSATQSITVNPLPDAGAITSADSVCIDAAITLLDPAMGGVWSSNNGNASVSGAGVVTGVSAGLVTIQYAVTNSCGNANATAQIEVTDCRTTGISTVTAPIIKTFPNPASSALNIEWAGLVSKDASVVITDVTGKVVLKTELVNNTTNAGTMQVGLSDLSDGMYLLAISADAVYYTSKIVVSKR